MMLDGIRNNAQSWGVKIAFGIIILVFVFWGVGSYTGPKGLVATVNGKNITEVDFQRAYAQMEENIRRSAPNLTPEQMEGLQLERRVLDQLVQEKLIESEAERAGLAVSPFELRALIQQLPFFQKDGKFDPETYKTLLKNNGLTPQKFEADQAKTLLPAKLQRLVGASAYVSPASARALFDYAAERRTVEYILFPAAKHKDMAAPTVEEVAKAYEEQSASFAVPATVKLEIARLDPAAMGDPASISEADLRAAYDARLGKYTEAEKISARHILIRLAPNASDADVKKAEESIKALEARIRGGEDFAAVAKAHGQDGTAAQGGDLGWFTDGQMVPEFSKAAFALKDGEVSAPVRTQFGFHLIKKEGHQAAKVHSFEEVKDSLRTELATENASRGIEEKADIVLAQALAGKSMDEAAKAAAVAGVKVETTPALSAAQLGAELGIRESDVRALMNASAGTVFDTPVAAGPALLVVKVLESKPQSVQPLEEVRSILVDFLTMKKSSDLALEEARKVRASFKDGMPAEGMEVKISEPFGRDGNLEDLLAEQALGKAAFAAAPGSKWMEEAFRVQDGAVLARLATVQAPSEEEWKMAEADVNAQMMNDRMAMLYQTYIEQLAAKADIKTYNSPLLGKLHQQ